MTEFSRFIYCLVFCLYVHIGRYTSHADVRLKLSNDGPAILDSQITFNAVLTGDIPEDEYEYKFEDDTEAPTKTYTVTGGKTANLTILVSKELYQHPGLYTMKVTVYKTIFKLFPQFVTSGKTAFRLTDGINGDILVDGQAGQDYIPAGKPLNFSFLLHDPSHFFSGARFVYIWTINQTAFFNKNDSIVYTVGLQGKLDIFLAVFASLTYNNQSMVKSGYINQTFRALVPVNNLTVQGSVWMKRGEVMSLYVSCNGTSPYRYCAKVFLGNGSDACNGQDPVTSTQCSFRVMHYFETAGKYRVGLMVRNSLNTINRTVDVQVYDVDKRPQLSTIIFPIASCCIGIVIVVIGAAYHLQQRRTYTIEVADFDFQEPLMLMEKSFTARVKESIRDAVDNYRQGRSVPDKIVVNGSCRTTPIPSRYAYS